MGLTVALASGLGCVDEDPPFDPCAPEGDEQFLACTDALLSLSGIGSVRGSVDKAEVTPIDGIAAYYGAVYVQFDMSEAVDIELRAVEDGVAETCPATQSQDITSKTKWIGIDAQTTAVEVYAAPTGMPLPEQPLYTFDSFDARAGSTVTLDCHSRVPPGSSNSEPHWEIDQADFGGNQVYRTYLTIPGDRSISVRNNNPESTRVDMDMDVLVWVDANLDPATCTAERSYDDACEPDSSGCAWQLVGIVPADSTSNLTIPPDARAIEFRHVDGFDYEGDDGPPNHQLARDVLELIDDDTSTIRFERLSEVQGGCTTGDNLPVAVPFVGTRANIDTVNNTSNVSFENCTDTAVELHTGSGNLGTLTLPAHDGSSVCSDDCSMSTDSCCTLTIEAYAQEVWSWDIGGDPTVIIRKKGGCEMEP